MKTNVDEKLPIYVERTKLETLMERGRQLHDQAIFDLFARVFGFMKMSEPATFQGSRHKTPGWVNPK